MSDDTIHTRPSGWRRPKTGLAAWEATVGYISAEHSPDAQLTFRAYPSGDTQAWAAAVTWAGFKEEVTDRTTIAEALRDLWLQVEQVHAIFKTAEDAARRPADYSDLQWLEADTRDAIERLLWVSRVVFDEDWVLIVVYQPSDNPQMRVQMRLLARENTVSISGRGPSMRDACTQLYRNATPYFSGAKG